MWELGEIIVGLFVGLTLLLGLVYGTCVYLYDNSRRSKSRRG